MIPKPELFPPRYTSSQLQVLIRQIGPAQNPAEGRVSRTQQPLEPVAVEMVIMKMILASGIPPCLCHPRPYGHSRLTPVMAIF